MGLTSSSTGINACDFEFSIKKENMSDKIIALAGNPNVGKSTVFNALTGLRQHTGNWPGKTVSNAYGIFSKNGRNYILADIPGTYSLMAHSAEEEVARDFICFGNADAVIVVCDASCLERNLNLVLQALEITDNIIVCVNLMDEAKKKGISIDLKSLSDFLGVPAVGTSAKNGTGLDKLMEETEKMFTVKTSDTLTVKYPNAIENSINILETALKKHFPDIILKKRWLALRLLENDPSFITGINKYLNEDIRTILSSELTECDNILKSEGYTPEHFGDIIVSHIVQTAEDISKKVVTSENKTYSANDRKTDKILTGKITGIPIMLLMLCVVFWITVSGANIPSKILSEIFSSAEPHIFTALLLLKIPPIICEAAVFGIYRVLTWVISVMLPPMAIFFPLFTLLEDLGVLPRIAFNMDKSLKKCRACGKQALTMCMGFGCNAAGIIGCRIIDSPRERLIAVLTNNFVPCNGRFSSLITLISAFLVFNTVSPYQGLLGAAILTLFVFIGILATFAVSRILSNTLLKGEPSSFTLELPPYRHPDILKIIIHSIFDRTLFVLGRAVTIAAPAGLIIWLLANISINNISLLSHCSGFLDPFARIFGLDGVILLAFVLGIPANEIVLPIIIMAYTASGGLGNTLSIAELRNLLVSNGWTAVTAINVMLFSIMHWPCSTTLITIKKETGSLKYTALAFAIPTLAGFAVCFVFTALTKLFL